MINEDAGTLDFDLSEKEYTNLQLDPKAKYFNAGLLYMNLTFWRANNYTSKLFEFPSKIISSGLLINRH